MSAHRLIRALAALSVCTATAAAHAATFTVTTAADTGAGSLRAAITSANAAAGTDTIVFAIPGSGPHTITLASTLPFISGVLTIDGYSQLGSVQNTRSPDQGGLDTVLAIEITATTATTNGFMLQANADLTVQGLAMRGLQNAILGNTGNADASRITVHGSYIGTTIDGSAAGANGGCAIRSGFSALRVGGVLPWQRNLLSGSACGVMIGGEATVQGNLIGTDAGGTLAIPNGLSGNWAGIILASRRNVRIGGVDPAARNVISGNQPWGIAIWPNFGTGASVPIENVEVFGNFIGTDWTGTQPLPNGFPSPSAALFGGGVQVQAASIASAFPLGGFGAGEANLIAYNRGGGIIAANQALAHVDNRGNVIHHNRASGRTNVDLAGDGRTANDANDADTGPNNTQNFPEIVSATRTGNQLTITYRVDTAPANATYPLRIDVYDSLLGGSGDLIGQDSYPLASAQADRTVTLTLPTGARGIPFVTTATDANGYSSEFSPAYDVLFEDDFD
ncbi:hypothetical protein ACQQ2N_01285 [Dokdonella sp. MW10]|uniref:hypothetical protein n=1 Tax=Dokdonella sp. MW10 TaxID=2992926 RepID=UPI003F7F0723